MCVCISLIRIELWYGVGINDLFFMLVFRYFFSILNVFDLFVLIDIRFWFLFLIDIIWFLFIYLFLCCNLKVFKRFWIEDIFFLLRMIEYGYSLFMILVIFKFGFVCNIFIVFDMLEMGKLGKFKVDDFCELIVVLNDKICEILVIGIFENFFWRYLSCFLNGKVLIFRDWNRDFNGGLSAFLRYRGIGWLRVIILKFLFILINFNVFNFFFEWLFNNLLYFFVDIKNLLLFNCIFRFFKRLFNIGKIFFFVFLMFFNISIFFSMVVLIVGWLW